MHFVGRAESSTRVYELKEKKKKKGGGFVDPILSLPDDAAKNTERGRDFLKAGKGLCADLELCRSDCNFYNPDFSMVVIKMEACIGSLAAAATAAAHSLRSDNLSPRHEVYDGHRVCWL